ncbi:MAG: DegT/DnrJ/EryC1/StrS family aminotransferase [bacterium]|nr:DegT/DnrJ/EryC1/StrS family aminotransferase [bacterium]
MAYKIPLFQLNFDEAEENAVIETLRSKWISMGPRSQALEERFAEMFGSKHAVSIANCTAALHLALLAVDVKAGDEVLCPSLSFAATVNCIKYVGATPCFCDVESLDRPTISIEQIKANFSERTRAIIVMHYAGHPCDMDAIMAFANEKGIPVIEDACHAPLSELNGKKLGTIGAIGCYSFFSNKNISTGEGGMLITDDQSIYEKVKLLRSHGMTTMSFERSKGHATAYDIVELGYNYRMDDIRAAIGLAQLEKLPEDLQKRKHVRAWYLENLKNESRIVVPFAENANFSSNYVFTVNLVDSDFTKRDQLRDFMHENGIQTSVHYPAIHRFSIYQDIPAELPITEYVCDNTLTLPMFGSLTQEEVAYISETLKKGIQHVFG